MTSRTQEEQNAVEAALARAEKELGPLLELGKLGELGASCVPADAFSICSDTRLMKRFIDHNLGDHLPVIAVEKADNVFITVGPGNHNLPYHNSISDSTPMNTPDPLLDPKRPFGDVSFHRGMDDFKEAVPKKKIRYGLFITLEGLESAGKSTQCKRLKAALEEEGYEVVLVGEPGGTPYGQQARKLFLETHQDLVPAAEVGLLLTAKAQLLQTVIEPALMEGKIVICDRYTDTLFAYQHHAKGHERALMEEMIKAFRVDRQPDFTLLLRIDPDVSVRRSWERKNAGGEYSSFDAASVAFHTLVAFGLYKEITKRHGAYAVLNGEMSEEDVFQLALGQILGELENMPTGQSS